METNLIQGTDSWLQYRRGKLTASKAPIIMGLSPYQTPHQLWEEELGLIAPQETKEHMKRGLEIEDGARAWASSALNYAFVPMVVQKPDNPLFIASLDGIDEKNKVILEIKSNRLEYHEIASKGDVPSHHFCQIQHQLYVTGYEKAIYLSYNRGSFVYVIVNRCDDYIEHMVAKELEFKRMVNDFEEPPLSIDDYEDYSQNQFMNELMREYRDAVAKLKVYTKLENELKTRIREILSLKNARGLGWKATHYIMKGRVDYSKIEELKNIDIEKYRTEPTKCYRINLE